MREIFPPQRIVIWGQTVALVQELKRTDIHLFWKNGGLFSSTFLFKAQFGLKSRIVVVQLYQASIVEDLGPLKSKYLTTLRAAAQIVLKIIAKFNICKNISSD